MNLKDAWTLSPFNLLRKSLKYMWKLITRLKNALQILQRLSLTLWHRIGIYMSMLGFCTETEVVRYHLDEAYADNDYEQQQNLI